MNLTTEQLEKVRARVSNQVVDCATLGEGLCRIDRENLLATLDAVIAERDALRAIVDKLPKTADGVPIGIGSVVWSPKDEVLAGAVYRIEAYYDDPSPSIAIEWLIDGVPADDYHSVDCSSVFSTRSAAESALAAEGDSDAE